MLKRLNKNDIFIFTNEVFHEVKPESSKKAQNNSEKKSRFS